MPNDWRADKRLEQAALIDSAMPKAVRVADYFDGGGDNFEADRRAARALVATAPVIGMIAPARRGAVSPAASCGTWSARPASVSSSSWA